MLPILVSVYVVGHKAGVVSTAAVVLQRRMTASVIAANASMCNIDIKSQSQPWKETVADGWNKNMLDFDTGDHCFARDIFVPESNLVSDYRNFTRPNVIF